MISYCYASQSNTAILLRAVVRPDIPAQEEAEGWGREADMVGVNNI